MSLSRYGLSKFKGIGPIIFILGFHPVAISALRVWFCYKSGFYAMFTYICFSIVASK